MPRNSSGVYSLPALNPVVAGTTIDPVWANNTLTDLSTEMTSSLDRSGRGPMLAQLKTVDGLVATPSYTFTNEATTGLYRPGANQIGMSVAGNIMSIWNTVGLGIGGGVAAAATLLDVQKSQSSVTFGRIFNPSSNAAAYARWSVTADTVALNLDAFSSLSANANQVWVGNSTANPLILGIGGAEKVRLDNTGFCVGGTTIGAKFEVLGADAATVVRMRAATGMLRFKPYVDATSVSTIEAVNTAESAFGVMSLSNNGMRLNTTNGVLSATIGTDGSYNIAANNSYGFVHQLSTTAGFGGFEVKTPAAARSHEILGLGSTHAGAYGAAASDIVYNSFSGKHVFSCADAAKVIFGANGDITALGVAISRVKSATTSRNTTTVLADDPHLVAALPIGTWAFEIWVPVWCTTANTGQFKIAVAFSGTSANGAMGVFGSTGVNTLFGFNAAAPATGVGAIVPLVGTSAVTGDWVCVKGTLNVSVAGNISFQWCQSVSNANAVNVGIGGWMNCVKVG